MPPALLAKLERHIADNHRHLRHLLGRKCFCKSCQDRARYRWLTPDVGTAAYWKVLTS